MAAKASAGKPGDNELLITRVFDAPVSLVFRIWAEREHMMRWWGPEGFTCTSLELDFRPGGNWRASIVSDAYGESWMGGQFREIEKDRRIVYSFAWEEGSGETDQTLVTVTFTEQDGKTVQTYHQAPFSSVKTRDSQTVGWNSVFNKEQAYAERMAKGGRR